MKSHILLCCVAIALTQTVPALTQFAGSGITEYQLGNLPQLTPDDLSTLYHQLNLSYQKYNTTVGVRFETFQSGNSGKSYQHLPQRFVEWQKAAFRVRLGNYYTSLGRGLVLRAFELPNVLFEQRQFRRRYSYYRDIDGILAEAKWNAFEVTAFRGKPLNNTFPPKVENIDRRMDVVDGGQIGIRPWQAWLVGVSYLRTWPQNSEQQEYSSLFSQLNLVWLLQKAGLDGARLNLYGEHARLNPEYSKYFTRDKKLAHASYLSLNSSYGRLGLSVEFKDYRKFENQINLPPILYMEHSYYLLNRVTHELLAEAEKGYQFELTMRPIDSVFLLANTSSATNDLDFFQFEFKERFFEATVYWNDAITSKLFYNHAMDELRGDRSRKTGGANIEWNFSSLYSATIDLQHQRFERGFGTLPGENFNNSYLALTLAKAPTLSISLALDRSTDPLDTDDQNTPAVETSAKNWLHLVAAYQLAQSHELSLFYGTRRGGLACLSGTCYEVLPFSGLEARWLFQF